MNKDAEKRIAAQLAKAMAMICVRNTLLEDLHAGPGPVTRKGDYSDVVVLDADGNRIPWSEVSRINDDEMRGLMRQIVNRLCERYLKCDSCLASGWGSHRSSSIMLDLSFEDFACFPATPWPLA